MKLNTTITATLTAVAFALASTAMAQEEKKHEEKKHEEKEGSSAKHSKMDEAWLQMTAMSDAAELKLAKTAQEKGTSEQVKQHAAKIIQDHQKTSQELKQIAQKADIELKTDIPEAKREVIQDITKKSGTEFDQAYMQHEVAAHRMAVAHFENGAEFLKNPELKSFAQKNLPVLQQHLQDAQHQGQQSTGTQPSESRTPGTAGSQPAKPSTSPGPQGTQPQPGQVRTE